MSIKSWTKGLLFPFLREDRVIVISRFFFFLKSSYDECGKVKKSVNVFSARIDLSKIWTG